MYLFSALTLLPSNHRGINGPNYRVGHNRQSIQEWIIAVTRMTTVNHQFVRLSCREHIHSYVKLNSNHLGLRCISTTQSKSLAMGELLLIRLVNGVY